MTPQDEARDPKTSGARLRELAKLPQCLPLVAGNPAAPPDLLKQLAAVSKLEVLAIIVKNPNTPLKVLYRLAERLPEQFLENPIWPLLLIENPALFNETNVELRSETLQSLMRVPTLPVGLAKLFAQHRHSMVGPVARLHITIAGEWPPEEWEERAKQIFQAHSPDQSQIEVWSSYAAIPGMMPPWFAEWLREHPSPYAQEIGACYVDLTPTQCAVLARHPHTKVRVQLAQHPHLPSEIMLALARDESVEARLRLARHPALTEAAMLVLASDAEMQVRQQLARHPAVSAEALALMLRDAPWEARQVIFDREDMTPDRYAALLQGTAVGQWYAVANDPSTTSNELAALADTCEDAPEVLCVIARHAHTSRELLRALAIHRHPRVRAAVAARPRYALSKDEIAYYRALPDDQGLRFLAMHPKSPKRLIATLTKHADAEIRYCVALNPALSFLQLLHLQHDPHPTVRAAVAAHAESSISIFKHLVRDPETIVRDAVHQNANFPPSLEYYRYRITLNEEEQQRFRTILTSLPLMSVEYNTTYHIEAHTILLTQPKIDEERKRYLIDRLVQFSVQHYSSDAFFPLLASPLTPEKYLIRFATDQQWWARFMVARNPQTPLGTLKALAQDGIAPVRVAARAALDERNAKRRSQALAKTHVTSRDDASQA